MRRATEFLLIRCKRIARFLLNEGLTFPSLHYFHGMAWESVGRREQAAAAYARAIAAADRSGNRLMFQSRQRWQFALERTLAEACRRRVDDPYFDARISLDPHSAATRVQRNRAAGHYEAAWCHRGLRIDGFLDPLRTHTKAVRFLLDGRLLREVTVARRPLLPPFFQLTLQRPSIAAFPPDATLRLETREGEPLLFHGCAATRIQVPHGDGRLAGNDMKVDKKGLLVTPDTGLHCRQQAMLDVYAAAREAFRRELDTPLFLLYGTLLGFHRGGDFIPGDDDFDVGYVSACTSAREAKHEAMRMVVRLVAAGFTVSFNRNGRLFRLRLPDSPPHVHLDVHGVWFEDGYAWIHPQARLPCTRQDFLPTGTGTLRNIGVEVPQRPEAFLRAYYGASWRVPDPAYSTAAKRVPRAVLRNLARAFVTPAEYGAMQREIAGLAATGARPGRLISIGSHSLYPLVDYERDCDW